MGAVLELIPELHNGDHLTRDEFLRRWEAMPELKRAELIGGVVYMPSPLSLDHGDSDIDVGTWLGVYAASTPGCRPAGNATWLMLKDAPQPDVALRILPEYGGQSRVKGKYGSGAPELTVEVCASSAAYDLHPKLELYERAGVLEYVAVLIDEKEIRWHHRIDGKYQLHPADADGLWRSTVFPGLWLDGAGLLKGNMAQVLAVLQRGLNTAEHAAFVAELARRAAAQRKAAGAARPGKKARRPRKKK